MSLLFTAAIWADDTITDTTERLLLLALADFADDNGVCWPSVATLAHRACISTGHTRRLITRLIADGRIVAERSGGGAGITSRYQLMIKNPRMGARVEEQETRAPMRGFDEKPAHPRAKTRAPMRADPPMIRKDWGYGGKDNINGGEGETRNAALQVGADEVFAAWDARRWPLTKPLRQCLVNCSRTYSAGEVLAAIEIMNDNSKDIARPGAYIKQVLQNRASAVVDNAALAAMPESSGEKAPETTQMLFERSKEFMRSTTRVALQGVTCTNGDGWTIHIPSDREELLPMVERCRLEIRNALRRASLTVADLHIVLGGEL